MLWVAVPRRCPDLHTAACCVEVFAIQTLQRVFSFANPISAPHWGILSPGLLAGKVLCWQRSRIQPAASVVSLPSQQDPVLLQKGAGACPPQAVKVARLAGCDFDNKLGINDIQQNDKLHYLLYRFCTPLGMGTSSSLPDNCRELPPLCSEHLLSSPALGVFCRGQWCCFARCS